MRSNGCAASSLIATDKKRKKERKKPCAKWPGDDKRVLATHFISSPQSDAEAFRHVQAADVFFSLSVCVCVGEPFGDIRGHRAGASAQKRRRGSKPPSGPPKVQSKPLLCSGNFPPFCFSLSFFFFFSQRLSQSSRCCVTRDDGTKRCAVAGNVFKHTSPAIQKAVLNKAGQLFHGCTSRLGICCAPARGEAEHVGENGIARCVRRVATHLRRFLKFVAQTDDPF